MRHVCVGLHLLLSWLPLCLLLRRGWIWEGSLLRLVWRFDGQPLPELGPSLVVFCRLFNYLYFAKLFDYCKLDCDLGLRLRRHARGIFADWHNAFCSRPCRCLVDSLHQDSGLVARSGAVSFASHSNASSHCTLLLLHSQASSSSELDLARCDLGARGMHIPLVSCAGCRCYQGFSVWW